MYISLGYLPSHLKILHMPLVFTIYIPVVLIRGSRTRGEGYENYTKFMYLLLVFHTSNTDLKTAVRKLATETKSKLPQPSNVEHYKTSALIWKKNHELDTICNGTLCLPEIARCNCRSDIQFADKKKGFYHLWTNLFSR